MSKSTSPPIDIVWKSLLILTLFFYGAYAASSILTPIVFSLFITVILNPVVSFFERKKVPSILAIALTLLLLSFSLGGSFYYIGVQAKNLINDLPNLVEKFNHFIDRYSSDLASFSWFSAEDQVELIKQNADKLLSTGGSFFGEALNLTSDFLSFFTLVPIYVFFMLLFRSNFKHFLRQLDRLNGGNMVEISGEVKEMVHNYITGLFIVVLIIAVLNTIGLLALGLKYALFMGVLSAVLTVIPYIGIFIGGLLPVVVALLTKDSFFYPLAVIGIFALVQFLEGNFITPKIVGSKVNVNPLAAIIALLIGGKLWGIVGMILAIPLTGITKIIFSHYKQLTPYAVLLQSMENEGETKTKTKKA
jgi:predicted PurR-regulated permease PerM